MLQWWLNPQSRWFNRRAFFQWFYHNRPIWSRWQLGVFQSRQIRILWDNWAGTILKGSGPLLAQNVTPSWEHLTIQARWSHHGVSHLNCSKGWWSLAKILKSSKVSENAFTKEFFFCHFMEVPWFGWNSVYGCFRGCQIRVHCENWSRITFGWLRYHFCTKIGPILRMICCMGSVTSLSRFWSNYVKGWVTFAKILYSSKMGEIAFTISGWFSPNLSKLPDLDKTTFRQVFKIALIEPVAVIESGPVLGAPGPILTQNLALPQLWLAIWAWRPC